MRHPFNSKEGGEDATHASRKALLDAAESLFATRGFDGVSLRQLTQAAGTNLASVHYHFGSKESLFAEVIVRRLRPINARRLELLDAVLAHAERGVPPLEGLLDAFARPFFDFTADPKQGESLRRLIGRMLTEADVAFTPVFEKELLPVANRFGMAISLARPQMKPRNIAFGMLLYVGGLVNLLVSRNRFCALAPIIGEIPTDEELLQTLVSHGVAGFDALAVQPA